ncbi:MAG: HDOD domain-containing protein [Steroidobacteraceae bacterium]
MGYWLLTPLLLAIAAVALRPALRRAFDAVTGGHGAGDPPAVDTPPDPQVIPAPPAPLQSPLPPPAAAAPLPAFAPLEAAEIFAHLRALELGLAASPGTQPEDARKIAQALGAIGDAAAERRYFPRRPNLLPQLMHAIHDESVARRQLVAIIARDPALVDSLLRMANSSFYRLTPQPVESIERAVAVLGSDGLRSVIATALMQPIFNAVAAAEFPKFPQLVWEHALRSAQAAVVHAAVAERIEPFTAELLSLISGMAEIVLFRAVRARCAAASGSSPAAAGLLDTLLRDHAAPLAQRIGGDWQLSETALAALTEQTSPSTPGSALGRSLHFGRLAGALAVLYSHGRIDKATVRASLPSSALPAAHSDTLVAKLLLPFQDPRTGSAPRTPQR